jgi:hypothetical protein
VFGGDRQIDDPANAAPYIFHFYFQVSLKHKIVIFNAFHVLYVVRSVL